MTPEATLDRFFNLSADLLCIADFGGVIQRVNPAWERTLGFSADAVSGKPLSAFIHPGDWEPIVSRLAAFARDAAPAAFECRCRARDGEWRWLDWNIAPAADQNLLYASARDITDRRHAEAEIQKLAAFPRMNPGAVMEFSSDGRLTYFNDAALELARALGKSHPADILPEHATELVCSCLARDHKLLSLEGTFAGRSLSWSFHPVTASGVVHCYASDITERKRSDEQLREQAALLDKAQDAIVVRDLEHRILYWNKSAERVFGWTADEALGRNAFEMLSQKQGEACLEALRRVVEAGEWMGELHHTTKAGGEVIVEGRWTLLRDSEGRPKSILDISTDVTAKKNLEAQFLRAQRLESIGALASGIAHDLNNILAPIMMSVNLLEESLTDEHDLRLLETLRLGALRGAEMTKQILTFTRGHRGDRGLTNVKHLVNEVAKISRETFPRSIEFETDVEKDIWPIFADATQIHQVLMNLCLNARDAMPEGGRLAVTLRNATLAEKHRPLHPDARPGRYVRLFVADTGTGIDPEHLESIWDPFFTLKPEGQGTGLGLSTVADIVRSHGGFAHVESQPGLGTCFEVFLPASDVPVMDTNLAPKPAIPSGSGETILVVDDERAFQEITRAIFNKFGYRVLTASDGTEALAVFARQKNDIDLVLTDMMMPCLDGEGTIRGLQRLKPGLPFIATSGLNDGEALARELGGAFLLKPFTTEKLLHAVSQSLQQQPAKDF